MSAFNPTDSQVRPEHHVHDSSEILPGARGAQAGAYDYTPETLDRTPSAAWGLAAEPTEPIGQEGKNAFNSDRPLNVEPTSQGGVAIDGRDDLPEGKPKLMDKIIGKTEKVSLNSLSNSPCSYLRIS